MSQKLKVEKLSKIVQFWNCSITALHSYLIPWVAYHRRSNAAASIISNMVR